MKKNSAGFMLIEVLISTLMTGMIVLGVIALFLPLKNVMLKQNAWISLQNTAQTMSMLMIHQLKDSEIVSGSNTKITVKKGDKQICFFVKNTSRHYANNQKVSALYARDGLKKSVEWVPGVSHLSLQYDIKPLHGKKMIHQPMIGHKPDGRVVGVEVRCQLTAEQGIHEPWRIYVAI